MIALITPALASEGNWLINELGHATFGLALPLSFSWAPWRTWASSNGTGHAG